MCEEIFADIGIFYLVKSESILAVGELTYSVSSLFGFSNQSIAQHVELPLDFHRDLKYQLPKF